MTTEQYGDVYLAMQELPSRGKKLYVIYRILESFRAEVIYCIWDDYETAKLFAKSWSF